MKTLKMFFILLILALFLFACGSSKHVLKKPPFKFHGTTLAKGIERRGYICDPQDPSTIFSTQDKQVVAHLKFENLSGEYKLRWDWYDPNGNLYYSTNNLPIKTTTEEYSEEVASWHILTLQGDKAVNTPGQWKVEIFINNELVDTKFFTLMSMAYKLQLPEHIMQKPYPNDWGLIIGIEKYAHLPNVEYARKDALIVKDYFIKVLGVPEENIIILIDSEATKAVIAGYLEKYIPDNVQKDSTLYVYFAGHGAPGEEKGEPYLIPYDGNTLFIEQTGYKLKKFYNDLDNLSIERSYVFLDSCFSGVASRAAKMLAKGTRPALIHVRDVHPKSKAVVSISATSVGQTSNSYSEAEHGLFTYYLLRGLNGEADANDDHWISVKEVFKYVSSHVSRVARRLGAEQTPTIKPSLEKFKDISLVRLPR